MLMERVTAVQARYNRAYRLQRLRISKKRKLGFRYLPLECLFNPVRRRYDASSDVASSSAANNVPQMVSNLNVGRWEGYLDFGAPDCVCRCCGAYLWDRECDRLGKYSEDGGYSFCCRNGKVKLPSPLPTPAFLNELLSHDGGSRGRHFRQNIRMYNSMFQFTTLGGKIDHVMMNGRGPFVFRMSGQNYHRIGSLLPAPGERPKFAQLYIYDTEHEVCNRASVFGGGVGHTVVDETVVSGLIEMLDGINNVVRVFRMVRDRYRDAGVRSVRLKLLGQRSSLDRMYAVPVASEIAGLIVGDDDSLAADRDIIVEDRLEGLKRISSLHPLYMAMQYPLLFPYGEDGFREGILYENIDEQMPIQGRKRKRKTVTMLQYYSYLIQQRNLQQNTLLRGGRLFHQFLVDAFATIETDRLDYFRRNQQEVRSDFYNKVVDAVSRGDVDGSDVGRRIILPATFTAGPRYMLQNYQDAIAICRYFGFPDLFLTFTCNSKWPEIRAAVNMIDGQKAEDRPDLVSRVFRMKVKQFINDITDGKHFGVAVAHVGTIEFQKRGLPHVHILLWLNRDSELSAADVVNNFISAEIPDRFIDPIGHEVVSEFMIHGPCGPLNPNAACMKDGKCSKFFPKEFNAETMIDPDSFPVYRRRYYVESNLRCNKNGVELDNGWVVPYNLPLLIKYRAHINVELCSKVSAIKYLFKYINKGPDRVRAVLHEGGDATEANGSLQRPFDEIKTYVNCRYLSAHESCWRLFEFHMHHRDPSVQRLSIHLPNEHTVVFNDNDSLLSLIDRPNIHKTTFTEWMAANREHECARSLLYADFPTNWTWKKSSKSWSIREGCRAIGRVQYVPPNAGELYYLRLMVNVVKGAKSYADLRTVGGVVYDNYD